MVAAQSPQVWNCCTKAMVMWAALGLRTPSPSHWPCSSCSPMRRNSHTQEHHCGVDGGKGLNRPWLSQMPRRSIKCFSQLCPEGQTVYYIPQNSILRTESAAKSHRGFCFLVQGVKSMTEPEGGPFVITSWWPLLTTWWPPLPQNVAGQRARKLLYYTKICRS